MTVDPIIELHADISTPDPHQDVFFKKTLGFWIYLMTDCLIFATLFSAYAVLHTSTFGGPSSKDIYSLPRAFIETVCLLISSATWGLGILAVIRNHKKSALIWMAVAFICGATFVAMELTEFSGLVADGNSWRRSAFLSSFFALVGTHGLHVSIGLFWMIIVIGQLLFKGVTKETFSRLIIFSMFWHFLDLVWIFIFTFVYLMGVI